MNTIKVVKKIWGEEHWISNGEYCGKLLRLNRMFQCSIHHHKVKTETFFVIKGQVLLELGDNAYMLLPGCAIDVLPGEDHRFSGLEYSEMLEFSTHHEEGDSYRTTQSRKITDIAALNAIIHKTRNGDDRVRKITDFTSGTTCIKSCMI